MYAIRKVDSTEKEIVNEVVSIHMDSFDGFFLTFLGPGFLRQMYRSYCEEETSGLIVAFEKNRPIGFLAYSGNLCGLYKYMIKKRLVAFMWYSLGAFIRKPRIFFRLIRAFLKPGESKRNEPYVELASIAVSSDEMSKGIGAQLIKYFVDMVDFEKYEYITLETDAVNNDRVNAFYQKNGFKFERQYETHEGRIMNEYRYKKEN